VRGSLYGNADPVNHIDPSGNFFTLAGTMTAVGRQMSLVRFAFTNVGRQAGGVAIRNLGQLVERRIGGMIKQCLKPGAKLKKRMENRRRQSNRRFLLGNGE
jgi:hypothetical protein